MKLLFTSFYSTYLDVTYLAMLKTQPSEIRLPAHTCSPFFHAMACHSHSILASPPINKCHKLMENQLQTSVKASMDPFLISYM